MTPADVELGQWWQFGGEPFARRVVAIGSVHGERGPVAMATLRICGFTSVAPPTERTPHIAQLLASSSSWRFLGWGPSEVEPGQRWRPRRKGQGADGIRTVTAVEADLVLFGDLAVQREALDTAWSFYSYEDGDRPVRADAFARSEALSALPARHQGYLREAGDAVIGIADDLGLDLVEVIAMMERYIVRETKVGDAAGQPPEPGRIGYTLVDGRIVSLGAV